MDFSVREFEDSVPGFSGVFVTDFEHELPFNLEDVVPLFGQVMDQRRAVNEERSDLKPGLWAAVQDNRPGKKKEKRDRA